MSNRFTSPNSQFFASPTTGAPLALGTLTFYASGSADYLNTYSDRALTIANTNPIVLDSNGQAGNVFLQNLAYSVILKDKDGVTIWTADPVYASDFSSFGQVQTVIASPNGSLAGVAGSNETPSSMAWDSTNRILYVATTTGSDSTTVWTAINPASSAALVVPPQGYLTLSDNPNFPSLFADTTATAVLYVPLIGKLIPIYDGTNFAMTAFTPLTLQLSDQHVVNALYDVFAIIVEGVATIATGPAWTSPTERGTGPDSTAISLLNGLWVNSAVCNMRNGATTYASIPINTATYLGTIYMDGTTAGSVTCHVTYGQNRKWGVWNAYNRRVLQLKAGCLTAADTTASWTYGLAAWRASNNVPATITIPIVNYNSGTAANGLTVLQGLAEDLIDLSYNQKVNPGGNAGESYGEVGIAWNAVAIPPTPTGGKLGSFGRAGTQGNVQPIQDTLAQTLLAAPLLGVTTAISVESVGGTGAGDPTFFAAQAYMMLQAKWRG